MFGKITTNLLFIPTKETPIMGSSIAQSPYCLSNDVKAKLSRKVHGKMTLFASSFDKPMKICARLFLFDNFLRLFFKAI